MPTRTPASVSPARISASVMSGFRSFGPRISAACASIRLDSRSPPDGPGATVPASRSRAHQRIALGMLTPNRAAADRRDDPAATAAATRSLRSTDSAFDMPIGPPADG